MPEKLWVNKLIADIFSILQETHTLCTKHCSSMCYYSKYCYKYSALPSLQELPEITAAFSSWIVAGQSGKLHFYLVWCTYCILFTYQVGKILLYFTLTNASKVCVLRYPQFWRALDSAKKTTKIYSHNLFSTPKNLVAFQRSILSLF